jgi:hypothetical protein
MMKTRSFLYKITPAILLIGFIAFLGCPTESSDPSVDKYSLENAIASAWAERSTVSVSDDGSDVSSGTRWVTSSEAQAFEQAIRTAEQVRDDPAASQEDVDYQTSMLRYTVTTFQSASHSGTTAVPTGLTVTGTTSTSVSLSWDSINNASTYNIYRKLQGGTFDKIGTSSYTYYTDSSSLFSKTTYYYKVSALFSKGNEGPLSDDVSATTDTTIINNFPPSSSTSLSLDVWYNTTAVSSSSIGWYKFSASGGTYYISWNDSGNGDGNKYGDIKVTAYTSSGNIISGFSEVDSAYTTPKIISGESGTIYLKAEAKTSGSYAIKYSQTGSDPGGGGSGSTWPPNSVLSTYSLSGLTQPSGISGISWGDYPAYNKLDIQFTGTISAYYHVLAYLITKGGTKTAGVEIPGGMAYATYSLPGGCSVTVSYTGGIIHVVAQK